MFMNYPISQWIDVILYGMFLIILFAGICLVSVKLSNYHMQEQKKRKRLNKLRNKYHQLEKNNFRKVA